MPEVKDKIKKMPDGELMSEGLCFKTKKHLLSRVMSMEEHQEKRHAVNKSRPLSLMAQCLFRHQEDCDFFAPPPVGGSGARK